MTDAARPDRTASEALDRASRVRRALDEFLGDRASGKSVSTEDLLESHTDLRTEIAAELQKLEMIDRARERAVSGGSIHCDTNPGEHPTLLLVRCPHCQTGVDVDDEMSPAELHCSACGQSFRVISPWDGEAQHALGDSNCSKNSGPAPLGRFGEHAIPNWIGKWLSKFHDDRQRTRSKSKRLCAKRVWLLN